MSRTDARAAKGGYHHGDLRAALLEAAVEVIAERGLHGLSLRECARRAGVSHAAPYRHFADKLALLQAIALDGAERLARAGREAMEGIEEPRERLDAYGAAYLRFAFENPVAHRVMFSAQLGPASEKRKAASESEGGEEGEGVDAAFTLLLACAADLVGPGEDPLPTALAAWSLVHGLATLILDGRIPEDHVRSADEAAALVRTLFAQWRGPLR